MSVAGFLSEALTSTAHDVRRPYRFGGLSFIVVGTLSLTRYGIDLVVGPPPSNGAEILAWRTAHELPLAISNEVLFFVAGFLIPAVIALYWSLARVDATRAAAGCGLLAVVIPIIAVLDIVHGRLVYPVYGLRVETPAVAELVLAVYVGGLHAVALLVGLATIVLSLVMRHGIYGRNIASLGFAAGLFDFVGAYPETVGPALILVSQVLSAIWFLALGSKLYGVREPVAGAGGGERFAR